MLTVGTTLILDREAGEVGKYPLATLKSQRNYTATAHMDVFWNNQVIPLIGAQESTRLYPTFKSWVVAPVQLGNGPGHFVSVSSASLYSTGNPPPPEPTEQQRAQGGFWPELALQNTQDKYFPSVDSLIKGLKGNLAATHNRDKEERLALDILANLKTYEKTILDPLITTIQDQIEAGKYSMPANRSYYGEGAVVNWQAGIVETLANSPELERLYKKVAAIHDFCRCVKFKTPNRNAHTAMRLVGEKYSLDESNAQVARERRMNNSIWAGKSGSAMDMMFAAKQLGVTDVHHAGALAFCIVAFFHYMPTSVSSTHTYHEVMAGAAGIFPEINQFYAPSDVPNVQETQRYFESRARPWQADNDRPLCVGCGASFGVFTRRHHCRACGEVFCATCTTHTKQVLNPAVRPGKQAETGLLKVCDSCFNS